MRTSSSDCEYPFRVLLANDLRMDIFCFHLLTRIPRYKSSDITLKGAGTRTVIAISAYLLRKNKIGQNYSITSFLSHLA